MSTYTVPTTANYRDSITGAAKRFKAGEIIPIEDAVRFGMPGAELPAAGSAFTSAQDAQLAAAEAGDSQTGHTHAAESEARTVTADGTGTGTVTSPASGSVFVPVTSGNANHILTLPAPTPNTIVAGYVGANGFELRSSAPASVGINGGTGAGAESAIPANTFFVAVCPVATNWLLSLTSAAGVVSAGEVAAA